MGWLAVDALSDARSATQSLLFPVDRGRWLRLALVALFVGGAGGFTPGGGGGGPNVSGSGSVGTIPESVGETIGGLPGAPPRGLLVLAGGLVLLLLAVVVLWAAVGAVMEFVLVDGLRFRTVRIRGPFREHLGRGLRLFGFRVAVGLVLLALVAIPAALVLGGVFLGLSPLLLLLLVPVGILLLGLALVAAGVGRLTTDFVVPTMLVDGRGVLAGWRRLWPLVKREWKETLVYLVLRYVLGAVVGVGVAIVVAMLALVVAIPFVLVGALGWVVFASGPGGLGTAGLALLVVLVALFLLAVFVVGTVVRVPVVTFFRYYALFVLGGLDADLDLVGDLRVPAGTGEATDADAADGSVGTVEDAADEATSGDQAESDDADVDDGSDGNGSR